MNISVTGHRPNKLLNAYPETEAYKILVKFSEWVLLVNKQDIDIVYTGMALGFDLAIAQACINLGCPFIAAVPFKGQESMWPHKSQQYYREVLQHAFRVDYVCEPGYSNWKMQKRNEYMVDNSGKQFSLWDGTSGGTANCVKYAKAKGVETVNLYSEWIKCAVYFGLLPF